MLRLLLMCVAISVLGQQTWGSALPAESNGNLGVSGGKTVTIDSAPFMAALVYTSKKFKSPKQFCGGSIIHERFILTAAHCLAYIPRFKNVKVLVGSHHLNSKGQVLIDAEKKFCHKKYRILHYDICLLKLKTPVRFGPNVVKAELPGKDFTIAPGTNVNITGWGDTESDDDVTDLRQVTVPIVSLESCRRKFSDDIDDLVICAGSKGHDACSGDSGGPLTYRNKVIGLVSYGSVCSYNSDGIGVYTKVTSYLKWINKIIRNHS